MSESGRGGTRWLKYGCFGCLGLVGLVVLLIAAVAGVAWMGAENPQIEDRAVAHALPESDTRPSAGSPPAGSDTAAGRPTAGAGRVTLDLSHAEFKVRPGEPGTPLRVEASYDTRNYTMEETFEAPEGEEWHYTFRFRRTGASGMMASLRQLFSGSDPRVLIYLPPDAPIAIDVEVKQGGLDIDLGSLWLTDADFEVSQGGLALAAADPLREPMRAMRVRVAMGGAAISGIGNASPGELDVNVSMGGMDLDLSGEWRNDSEITIVSAMGGGAVRVPDNVLVEGTDLSPIPGNVPPEIRLPTLRFTPDSKLERVDVSR